jgi:hypothetical protein
MSKQIQKNPSRVSFDPKSADIERLDEIADAEGVSRAEKIRSLIKQEIRENEPDATEYVLPRDDALAEHYRRLVQLAETDPATDPLRKNRDAGLRVTLTKAKNQLYTNDLPKDSVVADVIRPLRRRGFVEIDSGMSEVWVCVLPLTEVNHAE